MVELSRDMTTRSNFRRRAGAAAAIALLGLAALGLTAPFSMGQEEPKVIPPPTVDAAPVAGATSEVALLAGGCFWGVQGVFQHVDGVLNAVSGYAGGAADTAHYDVVTSGTTGHAETVEITYDPTKISYGEILQIYFSVAHDPTQLNRQGPDIGTQYRSAIFPLNAEQAEVAEAYIAQLDAAKVYAAPVVTTIEADQVFYRAEDYHQDFMTLNPTYPYIVYHDLPKIEHLKTIFPDRYRDDPALVAEAAAQ